MIYQIKKYVSIFLSKLRWMGWNHPFWFVLGPRDWKLDGWDIIRVINMLEPGDIIITRVDGFVSTWLLPGFWNHAGVVTNHRGLYTCVVHSTAEGVHESHVIDFLRADHVIVIHFNQSKCTYLGTEASRLADGYEQAAAEYDFDFDFTDAGKFSCTELAAACYPDHIKAKAGWFGRKLLVADDIVALTTGDDPDFQVAYEVRHD
jgi:hypothetical protein